MTPESRLLTAAELAQVLNVPVSWCWKAARANQLPHVRLPGGRGFLRFDLAAVERTLEEGNGHDNPVASATDNTGLPGLELRRTRCE